VTKIPEDLRFFSSLPRHWTGLARGAIPVGFCPNCYGNASIDGLSDMNVMSSNVVTREKTIDTGLKPEQRCYLKRKDLPLSFGITGARARQSKSLVGLQQERSSSLLLYRKGRVDALEVPQEPPAF
jgi:hypothetical protein